MSAASASEQEAYLTEAMMLNLDREVERAWAAELARMAVTFIKDAEGKVAMCTVGDECWLARE